MNIPNLLTVARIVLTPVIAARFLAGDCRGVAILTIIAGLTDGADGYLARRFGWTTRLGAYLDPIADKLLLTTIYLFLGVLAIVPTWLVVLVIGRDLLILAMAGAGVLFTRHRKFPPSIWGKLSTLVQIVTAVVGILGCTFVFTMPAVLIWVTAAVTAWSGAHYVWRALRMLHEQPE